MRQAHFFFLLVLISVIIVGCKSNTEDGRIDIPTNTGEKTFYETGDDLCVNDEGKPIIRLFSTTWCGHCQWIDKTYEKVVDEYVEVGTIEAHNWVLDTDDDSLTKENDPIPNAEHAVYSKYNPKRSIPTFIFGCKYMRVGNGYESQGDLAAEEREFKEIIDELVAEAEESSETEE